MSVQSRLRNKNENQKLVREKILAPLYAVQQLGTHEDNDDTENLEHQPAIAGYAGIILQQLPLCTSDIRLDIERIGINSLYGLSLLCNHICELGEYLTELGNGRLDRLDGG